MNKTDKIEKLKKEYHYLKTKRSKFFEDAFSLQKERDRLNEKIEELGALAQSYYVNMYDIIEQLKELGVQEYEL